MLRALSQAECLCPFIRRTLSLTLALSVPIPGRGEQGPPHAPYRMQHKSWQPKANGQPLSHHANTAHLSPPPPSLLPSLSLNSTAAVRERRGSREGERGEDGTRRASPSIASCDPRPRRGGRLRCTVGRGGGKFPVPVDGRMYGAHHISSQAPVTVPRTGHFRKQQQSRFLRTAVAKAPAN